ncbi:unnamed protein product [Caenorhabditis angaria]|uniref:Uncharacterized protein n=1 Tax=Caenorhabditis angaria TaxID=860376 RepID=A0A9P1J1Z7_9PELO|nr:unnamed protein product [Caenorhabditis angaria]
MEVHQSTSTTSQAATSQSHGVTFPYISDFLPRVVLATSDYGGSECADLSINTNSTSDLSDESACFIPASLKNNGVDDEFIYSPTPDVYKIKVESSIDNCTNCNLPIHERTLLNVDGRFWHDQCLTCTSCSVNLSTMPTCYYKDSKFYCKPCYGSFRQFGTKCAGCDRVIQSTDWVRRARSLVFHLACFACNQCKRQLSTGEEYALQEGKLLCKQHFVELVEGETGIAHQKAKTKRVRTTFAEEQLSVLQAHFQVDSNPDGADLERIANMTGLSKRVTQVWFQNSRARQKKYQGGRKGGSGEETEGSRRSSVGPLSPGQKSDASNDMIYPTSVTTSAEDAMTDSAMYD